MKLIRAPLVLKVKFLTLLFGGFSTCKHKLCLIMHHFTHRLNALPYFLLALVALVGALCIHIISPPAYAQASTGDVYHQHGFQLLGLGHPRQALEAWQQAEDQYRQEGNPDGVRGSQLNQALALQALGHPIRACSTLIALTHLPSRICTIEAQTLTDADWQPLIRAIPEGEIETLSLTALGDVLRQLGQVTGSRVSLEAALARAQDRTLDSVQLALAATYATEGMEALEALRYTAGDLRLELRRSREATASLRSAITLLNSLARLRTDAATTAQAELFHLLASARKAAIDIPSVADLLSELEAPLPDLEQAVLGIDFEPLNPIDAVYLRLKVADAWMITESTGRARDRTSGGNPSQSPAFALSASALRDAISLQNDRAQSFAYGSLAAAKELSGIDGVADYEKALDHAQRSDSWDAIFTWQSLLAQRSQERGEYRRARSYYVGALEALDRLRQDLISVSLTRQFGFNTDIQPVYRGFMQLLSDAQDTNVLIETFEALTQLELEDYLRCQLAPIRSATAQLKENETFIYLIELANQIVVIAKTHTSTHTFFVDSLPLRSSINHLILNTQSPNFLATPEAAFLPYAQDIYAALLKPLETNGLIHPEDTLILIPDSTLRNIPFSLLHTGESYLIERYRLSTLLPASLPTAHARTLTTALVAGLSEVAPSFALENAPTGIGPLPQVNQEIAAAQASVEASVLLNSAFTAARASEKIGQFPIVHFSTHGQFSSDPRQTVLLAWDKALDTFALYSLFNTFGRGAEEDGMGLLILSACQTAAGDERAVLGIAGIAAQAGARSTLATLWLIDAQSTVDYIAQFYDALSSGRSTADAVRYAALALLRSDAYSHPFYWGSFLLVGDWR